MARKKHVHKYHLVPMYNVTVWACALPDCSHYMPDHMKEMLPGKASICWGCNEKMLLDPANMKDEMPLCSNCLGITKPEPEQTIKSVSEYLEQTK